jgi:hypothetical protein
VINQPITADDGGRLDWWMLSYIFTDASDFEPASPRKPSSGSMNPDPRQRPLDRYKGHHQLAQEKARSGDHIGAGNDD